MAVEAAAQKYMQHSGGVAFCLDWLSVIAMTKRANREREPFKLTEYGSCRTPVTRDLSGNTAVDIIGRVSVLSCSSAAVRVGVILIGPGQVFVLAAVGGSRRDSVTICSYTAAAVHMYMARTCSRYTPVREVSIYCITYQWFHVYHSWLTGYLRTHLVSISARLFQNNRF